MSASPKEDILQTWAGLRRVAIVGAATLKGRELKDALEERKFPAVDVKLLDDDETLGQIDAVGEEATFIQSVRAQNFEHVDFAFFAADAEFTRKHWHLARDVGAVVIDLSYGLEDEPGAMVRAPWIERERGAGAERESKLIVSAHPAAIVLALLLGRAARAGGLRTAVATVFEPASETGRRGMDELHQQTVSLLSFQPLPKDVFDIQVAFNLVSRYGGESAQSLENVERRILRHLATLTSVPAPSLMLLQGPTFHAHAFSIYLEVERPVALGDMVQTLAGEHVSVARLAEDAPTNVSAAGQPEVQVAVRRDTQRENGFWLWAAADNLVIAAVNAVECAETSTAVAGRVQ